MNGIFNYTNRSQITIMSKGSQIQKHLCVCVYLYFCTYVCVCIYPGESTVPGFIPPMTLIIYQVTRVTRLCFRLQEAKSASLPASLSLTFSCPPQTCSFFFLTQSIQTRISHCQDQAQELKTYSDLLPIFCLTAGYKIIF